MDETETQRERRKGERMRESIIRKSRIADGLFLVQAQRPLNQQSQRYSSKPKSGKLETQENWCFSLGPKTGVKKNDIPVNSQLSDRNPHSLQDGEQGQPFSSIQDFDGLDGAHPH